MPKLSTQQEVAEFFGVTATAVRKWEAHPAFPIKSKGRYDTDLIRQWRDIHLGRQQGSQQSEQANQIAVALKAVKLKREQLRLEEEEENRRRARGDILSREEMEMAIAEIITVARDRLNVIPGRVARVCPRKFQSKVRSEAEKVVRAVLEDMASMFETMEETDEPAD